jgi:hypothetical protein
MLQKLRMISKGGFGSLMMMMINAIHYDQLWFFGPC